MRCIKRNVNTHRMFFCRLQREGSSNRWSKVPDANNRNVKKTVNCNEGEIELA